jgi:hypothetical protein
LATPIDLDELFSRLPAPASKQKLAGAGGLPAALPGADIPALPQSQFSCPHPPVPPFAGRLIKSEYCLRLKGARRIPWRPPVSPPPPV